MMRPKKKSGCRLHDKQCFLSNGQAKATAEHRGTLYRLMAGCALTFMFMVGEMVAGKIANSVAIFSDAAHMLSDVFGFIISISAALAVTRSTGLRYSYGYHRVEILGALASVLIIWVITGVLVYEAVLRVITPREVDGKIMFIVGMSGLAFNIIVMCVLGVHGHHHGHDHGHDHGHGHGHNHGTSHKHDHSDCDSDSSHAAHAEGSHHHTSTAQHTAAAGVRQQAGCSHSTTMQAQGSMPEVEVCLQLPLHEHHDHDHDDHDHHDDHAGKHKHKHSKHSSHAHQDVETGAGGCKDHHHHDGHHDHHSHNDDHDHDSHDHGNKDSHDGHSHHDDDHHDHHENINLRSALVHVFGDALQSIGVAIAGGMIWAHQGNSKWYIVDPISTFVFAILVLLTTRVILRDIMHTLMERAPVLMDVAAISKQLQNIHGVADVHDFHAWQLTAGLPILTAHVHITDQASASKVLGQLEAYLRSIGIDHSTIQICNVDSEQVQLLCSRCGQPSDVSQPAGLLEEHAKDA